jgi:acetyl esterase/lipase
VVDFLELMIRATPVDVVAGFYLALLDHDERDALPAVGRVPVLVLAGERDRLIPARINEQLAAGIPGAELVRLPGAGHVVILERPAEVNEAITRLVGEAVAGGALNGRSRRRRRRARWLSSGCRPERPCAHWAGGSPGCSAPATWSC